ncbi:hypothetical protein ACQKFN_04620 [Serratia sp. NPDC071084]|uniref:hypothetical protein n=1 Tax=Serratia sp. NPDC071084 TaxID=3390676 RepID=UPI003CFCD6D6
MIHYYLTFQAKTAKNCPSYFLGRIVDTTLIVGRCEYFCAGRQMGDFPNRYIVRSGEVIGTMILYRKVSSKKATRCGELCHRTHLLINP